MSKKEGDSVAAYAAMYEPIRADLNAIAKASEQVSAACDSERKLADAKERKDLINTTQRVIGETAQLAMVLRRPPPAARRPPPAARRPPPAASPPCTAGPEAATGLHRPRQLPVPTVQPCCVA